MKFLLFRASLVCLFLTFVIAIQAQTLTGTYTLPGIINGTTITNLKELSTFLANAANPVSGNVVFEFGPTYTSTGEVFPIAFNGFTGTGTVTIRPSAAVTTSLLTNGNLSGATTPLIDLSGADYMTFDGRPGGTGNNILWTFRNINQAGVTFLLRDATYNTLQYLQIESQCTTSTGGTVVLTNNNHNNTIQNCLVTNYAAGAVRPVNGIISYSATATPNTNNSILYNEITNFAPTSIYEAAGINITGTGLNTNYSSGWTIRGNNFYHTTTEVSGAAAGFTIINFVPGTGSTGNVIDENYIGGNSPFATGMYNTQVSGANAYIGILVRSGSMDITNNVIKGVTLTNTNLVSTLVGIQLETSTGANFNVSGNSIGNMFNPSQGHIVGIYSEASGTVTMDGNSIFGLNTTNGLNQAAKSIGIYTNNGAAVITNNVIFGLASATGTGTSTTISSDAAAAGIVVNSLITAVQKVSNNWVYNINSSQASTTRVRVYGIQVTGVTNSSVTHVLNGNKVYHIYGNAANVNSSITGIKVSGGSFQTTNNVVSLGFRQNGTVVTNAYNLTGIIDSSSGNSNMTVNVWHNSVYIGGTGIVSGSSYAFRRVESNTSPSNNEDIRNNIFVNNRSNSTGTGKHYAIYLDRTNSVASNYNILHGTGTGFVAANAAATDYSTLPDWSSATGFDLNSLTTDPQFIDPTATLPELNITNSPSASPADQGGILISAVVYDKDSNTRSTATPTDIGAYAICAAGVSPTITLVANDTTICAGTSVTFTANVIAGANYNFYRNGLSVQNGTSNTYTNSSLGNNDSIRVIVTASGSCVSSTPVSSSTITMVVTPSVAPTVILAISQNNICPGTPVTFTATPSNGGAAPTFNFYRNGVSVQNGAGNTYATSNLNNGDSVRVVLTSNAACASPLTSTVPGIVVVVKPNAASTINQTICFGDTLLGYTTAGVHRDTFTAANGCDSIRTLNLTIRPQNTVTVNASICPGGSYAGHTTAGTHVDTYTDVNGCDSIRTLNLTISNFTTNTISQTICFGDSYLGYNATGTYSDTFATSGCDSIRILNLTVSPQNTSTITQTICQGQSFEGYTSSGTYTDVFTDANGCDSTRTLNLTVSNNIITSENVTICFGDSYQGHTTTGVYRDTLLSSGGCDSIHRLGLTVLAENLTSESQTICQGDSYEGHTVSGVYIDTLTDVDGCDSIHTLTLTVEPLPVAPAVVAANNVLSVADTFASYQWYLDGSLLTGEEADTLAATANGNYTVVVSNAAGCADTSATFNLTGIGIGEVTGTFGVTLYPNPTNDVLHLEVKGTQEGTWALFNSLGQQVQNGKVQGVAFVNLTDYADGVYYLKIQLGNEVVTRKVIKAK